MKSLNVIFTVIFAMTFYMANSQESLESLKAMKAEKEAVKKGIDEEIAGLDKQIKEFPGWSRGLGVTLGMNFGGVNNWYGQDIENSTSRGFGIAGNAYANKNGEGFFWHNTGNVAYNTSTQKNTNLNDDGTEDPEQEITNTASLFTLNSIAGKQIFGNVFASAEARYETTFNQFNDPGTLTASLGFTWKPMNDLIVVVHPLAYQINFPSAALSSAAGAKIGATYTGEIAPGIKWNSDLNAFLAYGGDTEVDPDKPFSPYSAGALSNWTWLNTFAVADVFKGVGVGFTLGLRSNDQLAFAKTVADPGIQSFYTLGFTYAIAR